MSDTPGFRYRPEIDGLRAIAILAVVFYHFGFGFPGGFVGVDVFFVISGYLITSLIWRDLENGRFSMVQFWERRARRIAPALIVVVLVTLVAGWFVLPPSDYESLGGAAAAQALLIANIYYSFLTSGYFALTSEEQPLLHVWSLSVEEQFYLIVPVLLWAIYRIMSGNKRRAVLAVLIAACFASLVSSVRMLADAPQDAFYLLPSRAWELLFGAIVSFCGVPAFLKNRAAREVQVVAGLGLILYPIFFYSAETPFPGLAALPPCLGAALLIWATNGGVTSIGALLSTRGAVFIGLISYSLYLWHWPPLVLSKAMSLYPLPVLHRLVIMLLGLGLGVLSWKYVETPFRKKTLGATRASMFALTLAGLVLVLGIGTFFKTTQGYPQRLPAQAQKYAAARFAYSSVPDRTLEDARAGNFISIGVAGSTQPPTVMVWGDSHAKAALSAFDALLKEKGLAGKLATRIGTPPLLEKFSTTANPAEEATVLAYNQAIFDYIKKERIRDVVLVARWPYYERDAANIALLHSSLVSTVRTLRAAGVRPWILLSVPSQTFNVSRALCRSVQFGFDLTPLCRRPSGNDELSENGRDVAGEITAAGGIILDPKPRFLDSTGIYYRIEDSGESLYCDADHLTFTGAKRFLLPFLRDELQLGKPRTGQATGPNPGTSIMNDE